MIPIRVNNTNIQRIVTLSLSAFFVYSLFMPAPLAKVIGVCISSFALYLVLFLWENNPRESAGISIGEVCDKQETP